MGIALVQILLTSLAGLALWTMLRAFMREERLIRWFVAIGFATRAFAGALLFWISWFRLPVARSLQIDYGLWFFSLDGRRYFLDAVALGDAGPLAILFYVRTGVSVTYVQVLAAFTWLFGPVASVAVLLNLFCYLGMCLIVLGWLKSSPASRVPGLIALGAISLLPSAMLWALAPLKDTLFQLLVVCIIAAGALWQRAWRQPPVAALIFASAALLISALFAISGLRWYFGFAVLIASAGFLALTALTSRKKLLAAFAGAVLLFLLSQALVFSASAYLPPHIRVALAPWRPLEVWESGQPLTVSALTRDIRMARRGFESSGGATSIGIAGPLTKLDPGRTMVPASAPVTQADFERLRASAPQPPAVAAAPDAHEIIVPRSTPGRLIAGVLATVVPSAVARNLGLLEIGGGRGFWWFADIDTLIFDAVVLLAIGFTIRRFRWASLRNPIFWFVMAVAAIGIPLVYTVTNYGTLFRLRIMIFMAAALIPLALSTATAAERSEPLETEP